MGTKTAPLTGLAVAWNEGASEASAQRDDAYQAIRWAVSSLQNRVEPATVIAQLNRFLTDQGEQP